MGRRSDLKKLHFRYHLQAENFVGILCRCQPLPLSLGLEIFTFAGRQWGFREISCRAPLVAISQKNFRNSRLPLHTSDPTSIVAKIFSLFAFRFSLFLAAHVFACA